MAGFWLSSAGTSTTSNRNERGVLDTAQKTGGGLIVKVLLFCPISAWSVDILYSGLLFVHV